MSYDEGTNMWELYRNFISCQETCGSSSGKSDFFLSYVINCEKSCFEKNSPNTELTLTDKPVYE